MLPGFRLTGVGLRPIGAGVEETSTWPWQRLPAPQEPCFPCCLLAGCGPSPPFEVQTLADAGLRLLPAEQLAACRLVILGLNQGQKRLPVNRDLHLIQEALATRLLFGVDLLEDREAQLKGDSHPFQSWFENWSAFGGFFRGSCKNRIIILMQEVIVLLRIAGLPKLISCPGHQGRAILDLNFEGLWNRIGTIPCLTAALTS